MAKPGWCIVEADYQTAEMRGLAFISGDKDLMRMILEPDDCFGLPKPECLPEGIDAEDCVVRLKFPEYVHLPADKDKFLLTYTADGEIKATFTEDQLQRNPDGSFKGPRFDMHWGACELSRNTCREVMNKKKDRGAAKVVNFCLVGDTLVLTNHGEKPIKSVQGSDLLWDGVSWVKHKGIIKYDKKNTISYAGLTATPDHLVWTGRGVITLLEAAIRGATLTETAKAGIPIAYTGAACACRERKSKQRQQAKAVCASRMPSLWKGILEEFGKLSAWEGDAMSLQGAQKVQNNSECYFQTIRTALQLHDAKMLLWLAQTISRLQSQGYQSMLLIEGGVYSMGVQRLSGGNVSWEGIRSDRQRWGLLENKLTTCDELNKSFKYEKSITGQDSSGEILRAVSADPISPGYTKELDAARFIRCGDFRAFKALLQRLKDEDKVLQSGLQNDVYDIIDAGERHRFTANGYLVANSSSYGGTATSISRKIEADTGVKATPEEAQALLDAVEQRQPRATEFFKEMEQIPEAYGIIRAPSGRIRHCHTLAKDVAGMTRTREGQLTALGRECRNFPMQESVGSSASRACVAMVDFHLRMKEHYGMQGYPCVCLYDSIVVHCPVEERQIWAKALDLFMNLSDGWYTAGGILRYPTDCEFNAGWSTKPDKEFKKQLYNQEWNPTPERLKPVEEWLDAMIQLYTDNPELSVYNKQDIPNE